MSLSSLLGSGIFVIRWLERKPKKIYLFGRKSIFGWILRIEAIFYAFLVDLLAISVMIWTGGVGMELKKTMTLNLTDIEMKILEELARKKELTKTAVIRQALRLYQMVDVRTSNGEKLIFEDDKNQKKAEIMVL